MVTRRPHTATISWQTAGSKNATTGVYTPGAAEEVEISCSADPNSSGRYVIGTSGNELSYSWTLFSDSFGKAGDVPDKAQVTFLEKAYKLLRIVEFQKHVEIYI